MNRAIPRRPPNDCLCSGNDKPRQAGRIETLQRRTKDLGEEVKETMAGHAKSVAADKASPSRCFLFCDAISAKSRPHIAAAILPIPPIPLSPPNYSRIYQITSRFFRARIFS